MILWSEAGYFDAEAIRKPLLHLWSLGVEEQFYLFWPLLLALSFRVKRPLPMVLLVSCSPSCSIYFRPFPATRSGRSFRR